MVKKSKFLYIVGGIIIAVSLALTAFIIVLTSDVGGTRIKLVYSSASAEKMYDATPLSKDEYAFVSGTLKKKHTAEISVNGSITDAGVIDNYFTVKIIDDKGNDMSEVYEIECRYGQLRINARPLLIQTDDAIKIYDGEPLIQENYRITSGTVLAAQSLKVTSTGQCTDAGTADNAFNAAVTDSGGRDVTHNYDITKRFGRLEVIKRGIGIVSESYKKTYDGTPLTGNGHTLIKGSIALGQTLDVNVAGSRTDAGFSDNIFTAVITDKDGKDVTYNYDIERFFGSLEVAKKVITLSTDSDQKEYDGKELTCDGYQLVSGDLLSDHILSVEVLATRTEAGVSQNIFAAVVTDGKGADITYNYEIAGQYGLLEVLPRTISISTASAQKVYDGTELTRDGHQIAGGTLVQGHVLDVNVVGTRTDAGISQNIFAAVIMDGEGSDVTHNYYIEGLYGTLEVLPVSISISTPSYHKVYDGEPLTYNSWEYASLTEILEGDSITVVVVGSQTDAGVSKNSIGEVKIVRGERDVTSNYRITYIEGDLIVTAATVVVRSDSAEKDYDGTPLTNENWSFAQEQLVGSHVIKVVVNGSQTGPGRSPNTIAEVIILTGDNAKGREITFNYQIVRQEGDLVVRSPDDTPVGGDGTGDLDESGTIGGSPSEGEDSVAVRVYSDTSGKIYLRYMSFGGYTGSKWDKAQTYDKLIDFKYSLNYLTGLALRNAGYISSRATIEALGNNYLLPYYLDAGVDDSAYTVQSGDVKHEGITDYAYSAYYYLFSYTGSALTAPDFGGYSALEKAYYTFVRENYLDVPQTTAEFLQEIIDREKFDKNNPDIIAQVARHIQNAATYNTRYDPELDQAEDIVHDFLGVYKEGICGHFASAATLLYRMLDIPARYTIGYVGDTKKDEWTDIYGKNAHAWTEVYISGLGWVQVEVTGTGSPSDSQGGNAGGGSSSGMKIKPVDVDQRYQWGVVLNAPTEQLQGLDSLSRRGYTYKFTVTGSQTTVGIGYSTITSFTLFDPDGKDVTGEFEFTLQKGKLHLYMYEVTLTTKSASKIYDGAPLYADGYDLQGEMLESDSFDIKVTGVQTDAGQSENGCEIIILDGMGEDASFMYKINKNYGTLSVGTRIITVTAQSATKKYDGQELVCENYYVTGEQLCEGDKLLAVTAGTQTDIGRSQNTIDSVQIINKNGKDVTGSYSISFINGWLIVTP